MNYVGKNIREESLHKKLEHNRLLPIAIVAISEAPLMNRGGCHTLNASNKEMQSRKLSSIEEGLEPHTPSPNVIAMDRSHPGFHLSSMAHRLYPRPRISYSHTMTESLDGT